MCARNYLVNTSGGAISHRSSFFGRGDGVVLLDFVYCAGTETRLIDCTAGSSVASYCSRHYYDAGVTCVGKLVTITQNSNIMRLDMTLHARIICRA